MFDYACITTIHDYLKRSFPGAFVRGFAGTISKFGDAHVFEVGEADDTVTLTVAHNFLVSHNDEIERRFDALELTARLRHDGWVVVHPDGNMECHDRKRLYSYAGSVGLRSRPSPRAT
jgi:hypothetical protein